MGDEVTKATLDFFEHGKRLKALNTTLISLIPKNTCPKNASDCRPIWSSIIIEKMLVLDVLLSLICKRLMIQ